MNKTFPGMLEHYVVSYVKNEVFCASLFTFSHKIM